MMNRTHTFAAATLLAAFCACTEVQPTPQEGANQPAGELTPVALECPAMD